METLLVERCEGVVTVTLNRPAKKNAISDAMYRELETVIGEVAARPVDRVLVLTGAGDGFCSGHDLSDTLNQEWMTGLGAGLANMRRLGGVAMALHELPKPTIAAVNGIAAGAGCNLAFGCDLIVASESARFSQIFVKRGLTVDFGGTWLLPRLVGLHKAKELAFLGDIISAVEAKEMGIVNRVVPADELAAHAASLGARLAQGPPLALSTIKKAMNDSLSLSFAEAVEHEALAQTMMFASEDGAEALEAFKERRDPVFRGY